MRSLRITRLWRITWIALFAPEPTALTLPIPVSPSRGKSDSPPSTSSGQTPARLASIGLSSRRRNAETLLGCNIWPAWAYARLHFPHMTTIEAINSIPDGLNSAARHVPDRPAYVEGAGAELGRRASPRLRDRRRPRRPRPGEGRPRCHLRREQHRLDRRLPRRPSWPAVSASSVYYDLKPREIDEQVERPGCRFLVASRRSAREARWRHWRCRARHRPSARPERQDAPRRND